MIDKEFCMSSYLAFRYIEDENKEFCEDLKHDLIKVVPETSKIPVHSSAEIDKYINISFKKISDKKKGILLSGGMDSAILAAYMPNSDAYTFRFENGEYQKEELKRAEYYAKTYNLNLHYIDISWNVVEDSIDLLMKRKGAPVHSIEPQIYTAARAAKNNGIEIMLTGESSDLVFGGMDQLLAKDWKFEEFMNRYIFLNPKKVLKNPADMTYLFERYRKGENIDFMKFMDDIFSVESSSSYYNAFGAAEMDYLDPYAQFKMGDKLDLDRVRNGEPKYLIRELFHTKYPEIEIPNKVPMPRPVDIYFKDWSGPKRPEFLDDLDMTQFTGNQKWQMYCLERFLNTYINERGDLDELCRF